MIRFKSLAEFQAFFHEHVKSGRKEEHAVGPCEVTPEIAAFLSGTSKGNVRTTSKKVVATIQRDIMEGHWEDRGDPVRVHQEGDMYDGHHRLLAVYQSGRSVVLNFFFGSRTRVCDGSRARTLAVRSGIGKREVAAIQFYAMTFEDFSTLSESDAQELRSFLEEELKALDSIVRTRAACVVGTLMYLYKINPRTVLEICKGLGPISEESRDVDIEIVKYVDRLGKVHLGGSAPRRAIMQDTINLFALLTRGKRLRDKSTAVAWARNQRKGVDCEEEAA